MSKLDFKSLSRRERQIMDVIYSLGKATVLDVQENLPDPPSVSAVRTMLGILKDKGLLSQKWQGPKKVYHPVVSENKARSTAMKHLQNTFFRGSAFQTMTAFLNDSASELSDEDLDSLALLIEEAKKKVGGN